MFFKPRIFISSTLSENLAIRNELHELFNSVGAEIMLYEKNLTPSINPLTYRADIRDADFVIFIIKDKYGTETSSGLSGTHEELKISLDFDIPKHVYIKLSEDNHETEKLIDDINEHEISYYYFKDDNELISRIKQTIFIIARDIMIRKVEQTELSYKSAKLISVNYDYKLAIGYLKIFDTMIDLERNYNFDYINTNLIIASLESIYDHNISQKNNIFIDNKINELLNNVLKEYYNFASNYAIDYVTGGNYRDIKFPVYGNIKICDSVKCPGAKYTPAQYIDMIKAMLEKYFIFRDYIKDMKIELDIQNYK